MICENCGNNVLRSTTYFTLSGERIVNCKECPKKYTPTPLQDRLVKYVGGVPQSRRTVTLDNYISRSAISPDGEVYQDYKRKSFTLK